jgi:hypothetical protein
MVVDKTAEIKTSKHLFRGHIFIRLARGGAVVAALRYKSEDRGIDSR